MAPASPKRVWNNWRRRWRRRTLWRQMRVEGKLLLLPIKIGWVKGWVHRKKTWEGVCHLPWPAVYIVFAGPSVKDYTDAKPYDDQVLLWFLRAPSVDSIALRMWKMNLQSLVYLSSTFALASAPRTDHPRCVGRFAGFCRSREKFLKEIVVFYML